MATTDHVSSDKFLLNCGSSEFSSFNGKNWTGDVGSKYLPSDYTRTSTPSTASNLSAPVVPYLTARISHSLFTYSFPITSPGYKFIRLYFCSASYSNLNPSNAKFAVLAGNFTLLDNFTLCSTSRALKSDHFIKDFWVHVKEQELEITFIPSPVAPNAFAMVNGIEIFSLPSNPPVNLSVPNIGEKSPLFVKDETAFQILYRVDVPGNSLTTEDIFGTWTGDSSYVVGPEQHVHIDFSPGDINVSSHSLGFYSLENLYASAAVMGSNDAINIHQNLSWAFPVDSGFRYLIRLHFCEISLQVSHINQRVFTIFINDQIAERSTDIVALTGAPFTPTYRDYIVLASETNSMTEDIRLDLHPNMEFKPEYANAILNGIQIMKLSDSHNSLAARVQSSNEKMGKTAPRGRIIAGVVVGSVAAVILCSVVCKAHKRANSAPSIVNNARFLLPDQCREFSLAEIRAATNDFNEATVIGSGGFGKVYRGLINDGVTKVAAKRGNPNSQQGIKEFQNEIQLLSKFRHMHVVSLLGYCQEGGEMILVYEYMARGTLRDHLYRSQNPPLPWKLRLKICVGAARGLHYLHTGAKYSIIHRDIKTANILLDEEWTAKISDFGLSRLGPVTASQGHVTTEVKGTFGYLDPEYYRLRKLADKADVYSFGVVLFEVLSGRPAVKPVVGAEDDERVSLAEWALYCHQTGTIDRVIDERLRGKVARECLTVFVDVAVQCLARTGSERPSISDVLGCLERALQLQEMAETNI